MTTIAITAMAGIFPGITGGASLDEFGTNIALARRATLRPLQNKWGIPRDTYFDPRPGVPYRTYLDSAYTISDSGGAAQLATGKRVLRDLFESVAETDIPDPSRIGLCAAMMWTDPSYYLEDLRRVLGAGIDEAGSAHVPLGCGSQLSALAEAAGIGGPRLTIDAACASSLYALDAAIGFVESNRADAMVVLGLNAHVPLFMFLGFARLRALAPNGEVRPFAADASGLAPAEAVAAIMIEPLDRAIAAGRRPQAIVRGLGLSADGGDRSVFAPSPKGQRLAYERAYQHLDPASIAYVEGHGTATLLGDQTEIETLDAFFTAHRKRAALPIGSVKALVGHTLPTAGLASIIKVMMMLRDGFIAPHPVATPHRHLNGSCLRLPTEAESWPETEGPRRAAISAFGLGGSNAHLVLEAYSPPRLRPIAQSPLPTVAIMAVEAAMGPAYGCAEVARRLDAVDTPWSSFNWSRFSHHLPPDTTAIPGHFFPSAFAIEGSGLRMGPAALARVDPFQRIGIDLVRRVLAQESPTFLGETAIVCCANLGGEMSLRLARQYHEALTSRQAGKSFDTKEPTTEAIASSLSSMMSGSAAFHLGTMGPHETVAGDATTFWEALSLAPYWLRRSRALVLVAGRLVKSPVDADAAAHPGEGLVAFLLKDADRCRENGETPLALLRPASDAEHPFEISQLDPSSPNRGRAQQRCGFLDEATGVESLLRVLLTAGCGNRIVEVRNGDRVHNRLLIEKHREIPRGPIRFVMPLAVEFHEPVPRVEPIGAASASQHFAAWQVATQTAMRRYFDAQRQLVERLARPVPIIPRVTPPRPIRRSATNVVLEQVSQDAEAVWATLKVDEGHPYFFDHPLDHVPGVLILEGLQQLIESQLPENHFICSVDLAFKRFCEKDGRIIIRAVQVDRRSFAVAVTQGDVEAARGRFDMMPLPPGEAPQPPSAREHEAAAETRFTHKSHRENVLIGPLQEVAAGRRCRCDLLPPPAGHLLDEAADHHYSLLYVFETSRQFVSTIAHQVEKVPVGLPMILTSIRLQLERPAPRGERLYYECERQPVRRIGSMTLADLQVELYGDGGRIGESVIRAQVVERATYLKQRGLA